MFCVNKSKNCITGISGAFPKCDSVAELANKLFEKEDLITDVYRYPLKSYGMITRWDKFDESFFNLLPDVVDFMDPMGRIALEKTYEAIVDAGYNPQSLFGKRISVYVGVCMVEAEELSSRLNHESTNFFNKNFLANRISYAFNFTGPSVVLDSACASSIQAMLQAYESIAYENCEGAVIIGCNAVVKPENSLSLYNNGVFGRRVRAFDRNAEGFCKAEAVCALFVQPMEKARRIYADIVHIKSSNDGYKAKGIYSPSVEMHRALLNEVYAECGVAKNEVSYVECHGTGTQAGDFAELSSLEVMCVNRNDPLLIGSIKSNMGHAEGASGVCGIVKVIIAAETGYIPPNINLENIRQDIPIVKDGMIKVVTELTPWNGGYAGVTSLGIGGSNGHLLLKTFDKKKLPNNSIFNGLPYLVNISGTTSEAVEVLINHLKTKHLDKELVALLHEIYGDCINRHHFRGYVILDDNECANFNIKQVQRRNNRKLWFLFPGMGSQWVGMGKDMMNIEIFRLSIEKSADILKRKNMDLRQILTSEKEEFCDITRMFVAITAMQIGYVDTLSSIGISPDGLIGQSFGEIACAYADGCLSQEEAILCSYYRGVVSTEIKSIPGSMHYIGAEYEELKTQCPAAIDVAIANGPQNCVISGPKEITDEFASKLRKSGLYVQKVHSWDIAFHSKYIIAAKELLIKYLKPVVKSKGRSSKWISSWAIGSNLENDSTKMCSAEYFANNMVCPVRVQDALRHVDSEAIILEISPHGLFLSIMKQYRKFSYLALGNRYSGDNSTEFLKALGNLYTHDVDMKLNLLYPPIEFPVSRGTDMLAPLIRWNHKKSWNILIRDFKKYGTGESQKYFTISNKYGPYSFVKGHVVQDQNLFPGTGYLILAWKTLALMYEKEFTRYSVKFQNVRFLKAVNLNLTEETVFGVNIMKHGGYFEISESDEVVCLGNIYALEKSGIPLLENDDSTDMFLLKNDIYKHFRISGFQYEGLFQGILASDKSFKNCLIRWNNDWVTFLDSILQFEILKDAEGILYHANLVLSSVEEIVIDVRKHKEELDKSNSSTLKCKRIGENTHYCAGVYVKGIKAAASPKKITDNSVTSQSTFIPYIIEEAISFEEIIWNVMSITQQNFWKSQYTVVEFVNEDQDKNSELISQNVHHYNKYCFRNPINHIVYKIKEHDTQTMQSGFQMENSTDIGIISNIVTLGKTVLKKITLSLVEDGFLLIRQGSEIMEDSPEQICWYFEKEIGQNFVFTSRYNSNKEKFLLLRKVIRKKITKVVSITHDFAWISELQSAIKGLNDKNDEILLYSDGDCTSGILGFFNCLKVECEELNVRCFFIMDGNLKFSTSDEMIGKQLLKNLDVNVYKNGEWGTYITKPLGNLSVKMDCRYHLHNNKGDISNFEWVQSSVDYLSSESLLSENDSNDNYVNIHFVGINFKDLLLALGKYPADAHAAQIISQGNKTSGLGWEFSGMTRNGKKVLGIRWKGDSPLSNVMHTEDAHMYDFPDNWTLEEAATIPISYMTVLACLFEGANLQKGESVLIHQATSTVGLAAINVLHYYNCDIFVTVGTSEKAQKLREIFPFIKESHVGNSRDTSFELMIQRETNGQGVDIILSGLSEEFAKASFKCLKENGRFLDVSKQITSTTGFFNDAKSYWKNTMTYYLLDLKTFMECNTGGANRVRNNLMLGMKLGYVKPLPRVTYDSPHVADAFQRIYVGRSIGKILLRMRDDTSKDIISLYNHLSKKNMIITSLASPEKNSSYIIVGGLGGIGFELAKYLVHNKGVKNLLLSSRTGKLTGYHEIHLEYFARNGVNIKISTLDVTNVKDVRKMVNEAIRMGPLAGIFNSALVLLDKSFELQNVASFEASVNPKYLATKFFDQITRECCPKLKYFVVLSSVISTFGNMGQTNYGYANSAMEKICEKRRADNYPAVAIELGAIGDVGALIQPIIEFMQKNSFVSQPINACLNRVDYLCNSDVPVVANYNICVLGTEKREVDDDRMEIAKIIGLRELNFEDRETVTLGEIGLDSIKSFSLQKFLEINYGMFIVRNKLYQLSIKKLLAMIEDSKTLQNRNSATV